jgi:CheY-like chemotaxis protein/anti-sigma regulatory factor (Ser/Thr protein kinase)
MRILIVDDDSLNRFLLSHMLEEAGYDECFEAESGHEAIQLANRIQPDLVLLDVMMPDMDGYTVAPILKQLAGNIYLPIIFITSLEDHASLVKCLEVGGDDFASKPFDKVILTAKIRAHGRTRLLSKKTHKQNDELTYYRNSVEREHAIVEHIFSNALTINPATKGFFDYRLAPASSFNGDLFLIEQSPAGGMYFLMGDFTGHGLASAIGALPVARAFHAMAEKGLSVSEMVATLNSILLKLLPGDMFFAAALVEIGKSGHVFNIWNGGMPDLVLFNQLGDVKKRFESSHMALGILEADEFEDDIQHIDAVIGDRLLGYSDGLIELTNAQHEMFGEEALMTLLTRQPDINVSQLTQEIEAFRGDAEQMDDITMVSFTCQSLIAMETKYAITALPFSVNFELLGAQRRSVDPVYDIVKMVSSMDGMQSIRSSFSTVLSELFNNALDHGLLKLDSKIKQSTDGFFEYFEQRIDRLEKLVDGSVKISVSFAPDDNMLTLSVIDSGEGFDTHLIDNANNIENSESFGRGLILVKELCHTVSYSAKGNSVVVTFRLIS